MKNLVSISLLTLLFCLFLSPAAQAVVSPVNAPEPVVESDREISDLSAEDILHLERTQVEEKLGRKLKWKERLMLKLTKRKMKKLDKNASKQKLEESKTNGMAIAGFVCSIVGFLLSPWFILGILGVVFSATALNQIRRKDKVAEV